MSEQDGAVSAASRNVHVSTWLLLIGLSLVSASLLLPCISMGNVQPGIVCLGMALGVFMSTIDGLHFADGTVWLCRTSVLLNVAVAVTVILLSFHSRKIRHYGLIAMFFSFSAIAYVLLSMLMRFSELYIGVFAWVAGLSCVLASGYARSLELDDAENL